MEAINKKVDYHHLPSWLELTGSMLLAYAWCAAAATNLMLCVAGHGWLRGRGLG
jgi:hypothetical protein